MFMSISVLFTQARSNYLKFPQFDCWDVQRNAFNFPGSVPAIFHPPCRLFGRLRKFSKAPGCEKLMAFWAMAYTRSHFGIVEHPRSSTLWRTFKVGTPQAPDEYGGYLISINLHWFGFKAQKKTGLYIVGLPYKDLPALPLNLNAVTHSISSSGRSALKELDKSKNSETPVELCLWLEEVITRIKANKKIVNCDNL